MADFNRFHDERGNNYDNYNDQVDMDQNIDLNNPKSLNQQIMYSDQESKNNQGNGKNNAGGPPNATEEISNKAINQITDSLGFIGKYFNVEIGDVLQRLKGAIIPFNKSFYQTAEKNPDLYGPLWIYTTIVFVITVTANISGYLGVYLLYI